MNLGELAERLAPFGTFRCHDDVLRGELQADDGAYELMIFPNGRAIIRGTSEPDVARRIYARFIGT